MISTSFSKLSVKIVGRATVRAQHTSPNREVLLSLRRVCLLCIAGSLAHLLRVWFRRGQRALPTSSPALFSARAMSDPSGAIDTGACILDAVLLRRGLSTLQSARVLADGGGGEASPSSTLSAATASATGGGGGGGDDGLWPGADLSAVFWRNHAQPRDDAAAAAYAYRPWSDEALRARGAAAAAAEAAAGAGDVSAGSAQPSQAALYAALPVRWREQLVLLRETPLPPRVAALADGRLVLRFDVAGERGFRA